MFFAFSTLRILAPIPIKRLSVRTRLMQRQFLLVLIAQGCTPLFLSVIPIIVGVLLSLGFVQFDAAAEKKRGRLLETSRPAIMGESERRGREIARLFAAFSL